MNNICKWIVSFGDEEENECKTPNSTSGICVPVIRCDQLLNGRDLKLLRQSICDFDSSVPKVCCPISEPLIQIITTNSPTMIDKITQSTNPLQHML